MTDGKKERAAMGLLGIIILLAAFAIFQAVIISLKQKQIETLQQHVELLQGRDN